MPSLALLVANQTYTEMLHWSKVLFISAINWINCVMSPSAGKNGPE